MGKAPPQHPMTIILLPGRCPYRSPKIYVPEYSKQCCSLEPHAEYITAPIHSRINKYAYNGIFYSNANEQIAALGVYEYHKH